VLASPTAVTGATSHLPFLSPSSSPLLPRLSDLPCSSAAAAFSSFPPPHNPTPSLSPAFLQSTLAQSPSPNPPLSLSVLFPLLALPPSLASCSAFDSPLVAVAVPGSSSHLAGASGILFLARLPPPAPYPGQSAQDLLFSGAGGASRLLLEGKAERQESSGRETRTEPNRTNKGNSSRYWRAAVREPEGKALNSSQQRHCPPPRLSRDRYPLIDHADVLRRMRSAGRGYRRSRGSSRAMQLREEQLL
jgi:hypothetical protein